MPKSMDDASCEVLSFLFFFLFFWEGRGSDGSEIVITLNFSVKSMSFFFAPLHDDLRSLA